VFRVWIATNARPTMVDAALSFCVRTLLALSLVQPALPVMVDLVIPPMVVLISTSAPLPMVAVTLALHV